MPSATSSGVTWTLLIAFVLFGLKHVGALSPYLTSSRVRVHRRHHEQLQQRHCVGLGTGFCHNALAFDRDAVIRQLDGEEEQQLDEEEEAECRTAPNSQFYLAAIQSGVRAFDLATTYGSEEPLGRAMHLSGVPREEFFLVHIISFQNEWFAHTYSLTLPAPGHQASLSTPVPMSFF